VNTRFRTPCVTVHDGGTSLHFRQRLPSMYCPVFCMGRKGEVKVKVRDSKGIQGYSNKSNDYNERFLSASLQRENSASR
jgi:hypothetical protein